jgi:hypothetical protein
MNWKTMPYWVKGGVLALPVYAVLAPLSLYFSGYFSTGNDTVWFIAPEILYGLLSWGFSGGNMTFGETVLTFAIVSAVLLLRLFIIGAILGALYGALPTKTWRASFLVLLIVLYIVGLSFISHKYQNLWGVYDSVETAADCTEGTRTSVSNFNVNDCYKRLAEKTQDVKWCDEIQAPGPGSNSTEDYRGFCYEEVAHIKNDPSICPRIADPRRRDGCYGWFEMCEQVTDMDRKINCWTRKASIEKDSSICENIPKTDEKYSSIYQYCLDEVSARNQSS